MNELKGKKIALVVSKFYPDLSTQLVEGATNKYLEFGGEPQNLKRFDVPGSFEIPQVAQKLVESKQFHAIVCLGLVIRGETAHFDYVCDNVTRGVGEIAQDANIPVIFGVLTTNNKEQARERLGGSKGHKGEQAMEAALKMMKTLGEIQKLT
ncbi:MAG: 6,7-dimethyl-8-ribityllumazine synthase [Candidatus Marinimicrobia bacterium]|nr:6,7-dimethyl-8-ribityllumazine synthase [Candidatus Neomarinimicrobiota bacterium]